MRKTHTDEVDAVDRASEGEGVFEGLDLFRSFRDGEAQ